MANSSLVNVTVWASPSNYSGSASRKKINNACLHHMSGVLTAKQCGDIFARSGRGGSAHYGIGSDGKIGLYVDEKNVAWHAGNWPENQCSVGIEISNDVIGGNWHVSDKSLELTIKLVADILKRNGIKEAIKGKTVTWHSMFAQTKCCGDYLRSKMDYICAEVNKILKGGVAPAPAPVKNSFFPAKGYWGYGDYDARVGKIASFMYKTFPAYTKKAALGNWYGPNLKKAITEFQRRTGLETDGNCGPLTLAKLRQYGFKG